MVEPGNDDSPNMHAGDLPRAPLGWPVHSICTACNRALSRAQVRCSCGWEQRPFLVHVLDSIDRVLCAKVNPDAPSEGHWSLATDEGWIPIDRNAVTGDPLPNCRECIALLLQQSRRHAENGESEPFSGAELVRAIELARGL